MPYVHDIGAAGAPVGESMIGTLAQNLTRFQTARDERNRQINTLNTALANRGLQDKITATVDTNGKIGYNTKGSGNTNDTAAWELANRLYQDDKSIKGKGVKTTTQDLSEQAVAQVRGMANEQASRADTRAYENTVQDMQNVPRAAGALLSGPGTTAQQAAALAAANANTNAAQFNQAVAGTAALNNIATGGGSQTGNTATASSANATTLTPSAGVTALTPSGNTSTLTPPSTVTTLTPTTGTSTITPPSGGTTLTPPTTTTTTPSGTNTPTNPTTTTNNNLNSSSTTKTGTGQQHSYSKEGSVKIGDVEAELPTAITTKEVDNSWTDTIKTDIDKLMFAAAMQDAIGNTNAATGFRSLATQRIADMQNRDTAKNTSGTFQDVKTGKFKIEGNEASAKVSENMGQNISIINTLKSGTGGGGSGAKDPGKFTIMGLNNVPSRTVDKNDPNFAVDGTVKRQGAEVPLGLGFETNKYVQKEMEEIAKRSGDKWNDYLQTMETVAFNKGFQFGRGNTANSNYFPRGFVFTRAEHGGKTWSAQDIAEFEKLYPWVSDNPKSEKAMQVIDEFQNKKGITTQLVGSLSAQIVTDQTKSSISPVINAKKGINIRDLKLFSTTAGS